MNGTERTWSEIEAGREGKGERRAEKERTDPKFSRCPVSAFSEREFSLWGEKCPP